MAGGNLMPDAHSYVVRPADDELFDALQSGEYCYVLTSRQMGKSSLMHRTACRLQQSGITPILLDLTSIGANLTIEQWYFGLLSEISVQMGIRREMEGFWTNNMRDGPLRRFTRALSEILLAQTCGPVAIFIDEIDFVRGLRFSTDEFFACIRYCYNNRASNPDLHRLTFCMLGVATPADLIRDVHTTPFNIGQQIVLTDFTEAEASPLATRLDTDLRRSRQKLLRILHWSGGHPYLTQKLCLAVSQELDSSVALIDKVCEQIFLLSGRRSSEDNLIFVHNTIRNSEDLAAALETYRRVLTGNRVPIDPVNPSISILTLAGLVHQRNGRLTVRNRIYAAVFDRRWINANRPYFEERRERANYWRGIFMVLIWFCLTVAVVAIAMFLRH